MSAWVVTWVEPDATEHILTGQSGSEALWGIQGHGLPPIAFVEEAIPAYDGARLRDVTFKPREIDLPIVLKGATEAAIWQQQRAVLAWFNPTRGDGTLRIQAPDGTTRELTCRLKDGLQGDLRTSTAGPLFRKTILVLRAVDPFWLDASVVTDTYELSVSSATFFPFFPIRLTNSTLFNAPVVDNIGDVDAYPIWTVTGPGSTITLRNLSTDKLLGTSRALLDGETLAIDTRFGMKSITFDDGTGPTNDYASLSAASEFWTLQPGDNSLQLEMSGTTADSQITLRYVPRYLGI